MIERCNYMQPLYLGCEVEVIEGDKVTFQQAGEQAEINLNRHYLQYLLSIVLVSCSVDDALRKFKTRAMIIQVKVNLLVR